MNANATPVTTKPKKKLKLSMKVLPYLMILPAMVILGIFVIYPIFYMIYLSFFDWNMIADMKFVGLGNFQALATDAIFLQVATNTFQYVFAQVFFSVTLGLLLALYLKSNTRINALLQGVMFVPHVVSLVSVSFIWMWLMNYDYGLLNYFLTAVGLEPIRWLSSSDTALNSIVLISTWKTIGYDAIILISAIQAVPEYLYQAAALDRSSKVTTFFKITLPMISPSLFFLILMNLISAFKVFETISIMTAGGPVNSTNTFVYMIYEYAFKFYKVGYASSVDVVLMVILGICTFIYFKGLDRFVHYR